MVRFHRSVLVAPLLLLAVSALRADTPVLIDTATQYTVSSGLTFPPTGCGNCDMSPSYNQYVVAAPFNISQITLNWSQNNCESEGNFVAVISTNNNASGIIATSVNGLSPSCGAGTRTLTFTGQLIPASFYLDFYSTSGLQEGLSVTVTDVEIWLTTTGTIQVTNNLASGTPATFTITGPQTLSGSGNTATFSSVLPGVYTISYGSLAGFITPPSASQTLIVGQSTTFNGEYLSPGVIQQQLDNSGTYGNPGTSSSIAQVFVAGASGSAQTLTVVDTVGYFGNYNTPYATAYLYNTGNPTSANLLATSNTLTWPTGQFSFTFSPAPQLTTGQTYTWVVSFTTCQNGCNVFSALNGGVGGNYFILSGVVAPAVGTIQITSNISTATFGISPTIPGAQTGGPYPLTINNVLPGMYNVTFNAVPGYLAPSLPPQKLTAGSSISFNAQYTPINLTLSSPVLTFAYQTGTGKLIPSQSFMIGTSTGTPVAVTALLSIAGQPTFFAATQPVGATPTTSTVTVAPGLPPGTYTGVLDFSSTGAANNPVSAAVTLTVTTGPNARLVFPVRQEPSNCRGGTCDERSANISTVFDHQMMNAYESIYEHQQGKCVAYLTRSQLPTFGFITDFEDEQAGDSSSPVGGTASSDGYGTCKSLHGYSSPLQTLFLSTIIPQFNYTGAPCSTPCNFLYYDGHPGFDYPFPFPPPSPSSSLTGVYPAVSGCVTYRLRASGGPAITIDQENFHVMAIIPSNAPLTKAQCDDAVDNAISETGYVVFYLHLASYLGPNGKTVLYCSAALNQAGKKTATCPKTLEKDCTNCPVEGMWVSTSAAQPIAYVGNFANGVWGGVAPHLHFEIGRLVIINKKQQTIPLDPYGWWVAAPDPFATLHPGPVNTWLWQN